MAVLHVILLLRLELSQSGLPSRVSVSPSASSAASPLSVIAPFSPLFPSPRLTAKTKACPLSNRPGFKSHLLLFSGIDLT